MNIETKEDIPTRWCKKCFVEKPMTSEYFAKEVSGLFRTTCKFCVNARTKITEDLRMESIQKTKFEIKLDKREYLDNTISGRASALLNGYKRCDFKRGREFKLDREWLIENILNKNCFYCSSDLQIGADRIDNTIGHIETNVIPCCRVCNNVRSDIFTVEEMIELGAKIKLLRKKREILKKSSTTNRLKYS